MSQTHMGPSSAWFPLDLKSISPSVPLKDTDADPVQAEQNII